MERNHPDRYEHRVARDGDREVREPDQRTLRLTDAQKRIDALTRSVPDDVAAPRGSRDREGLLDELSSLAEELVGAHEQLHHQAVQLASARQLLDAERERFRELFEIAPEGHIITDTLGVIREVNRAATAILNAPVDLMIGKPLVVFVDADDRRAFRVRVYRARVDHAEEAWTATVRPRGTDSIRALFAVSPVLDDRGSARGLRWLIRDLSKSRANAVWERTPAAVLRAAIDALTAHVVVIEADGTVVTANGAWRDAKAPAGIFRQARPGANYMELCDSALADGYIHAEAVKAVVTAVLEGRERSAQTLYDDSSRAASPPDETDEADKPCWFSLHATRCEGPEPALVVIAHEDVTAQRRAHARETALLNERTARAAAEAASRAKSEFLATLSHELRTPLNAIAGYAQLLEMGVRGPVTTDQVQDLRRILRSEQHLLGLINELLNFARVERGDLAVDLVPVRVADVAREVLELIEPQAREKTIVTDITCQDAALVALADSDRLRQVLVNLLSNALKFTPSGGSIRILCDERDDMIAVAVADTGIGISAAKQNDIFEPFVQIHRGPGTSSEGIGLGLAISRSLARAMNGDLTVTSDPGHGSTFELLLSRAKVDVVAS